jgi:transcriptional regulator with XRE-family HTH domain
LCAEVPHGLIFGHGPLLAGRYLVVKRRAYIPVNAGSGRLGEMLRMNTIGERVRHLRKLKGLSQVELAKLAGITQGSLSLIEKNKTEMPAGDTLAGLCRALRTTPEYIISGVEDPTSIDSALQEHELLHVWRSLPPDARQLVIDNAEAVRKAFKTSGR